MATLDNYAPNLNFDSNMNIDTDPVSRYFKSAKWEQPATTKKGMQPIDKYLLGTRVVDWLQTRDIAANPNKFYEINPILGKHPSTGNVDTYFALLGLGDYFLRKQAEKHPGTNWEKANKWWRTINSGLETGLILNNKKIGVGLNFKF